jgi:farnesyl diphosphate synthase
MPEAVVAPATGDRIQAWRNRIDAALVAALDTHAAAEPRLDAAMRHAVLLGGKRMRPLLTYATGTAFGAAEALLDAPAAAVELVHAYSLVHDDLPAMDDDALRRGRPTVHVAFGEATAVLAGDALQSLAFALLADGRGDARVRLDMVRELAEAAGSRGMCGGQALDLAATGGGVARLPLAALEDLHARKTGALLRAAVRLGAMAAGIDSDARVRLERFAAALGLAFQVRDDLLDVEGDSATLGKTAGKDAEQAKSTFPALVGVAASRERLQVLAGEMEDALAPFGARVAVLAALGREAVDRSH